MKQMKQRKRSFLFSWLSIVLVIAFLLGGCAGGSSVSDGQSESNPNSTANDVSQPITDEEIYEGEDDNMSINIVDNQHENLVITESKFNTPAFKKDDRLFKISTVYGSNMVLQANMNCRIFGTYYGDEQYVAAQVKENGNGSIRTFYGAVGENDEFEIWLGSTNYGGPYTITIFDAAGYHVTWENVLFGEVFVLSGQSNMEWTMGQCFDGTITKLRYQSIIDGSANNRIRYMGIANWKKEKPADYLETSQWETAAPDTVVRWSAVGYFFASRMMELYNVPIGMISACMGATSIHDWEVGAGWYNGRVSPLRKLTIRGVCWYQGEAEAGDKEYGNYLTTLIKQWREAFDNPNLYWAAVQLPRFQRWLEWAVVREGIRSVKDTMDKYTYCVTLDTGLYPEWKAKDDAANEEGIHPYDKQYVGIRLADAMAKDFYGAKGLWTSPVVKSVAQSNGKIIVTFSNVGAGLVLQGTAGFEIAGSDCSYRDATPTLIDKNTVALTCADVSEPVFVRYGYKNVRGDGVTSAADSVCVYNSRDGVKTAYPAEQFVQKLK